MINDLETLEARTKAWSGTATEPGIKIDWPRFSGEWKLEKPGTDVFYSSVRMRYAKRKPLLFNRDLLPDACKRHGLCKTCKEIIHNYFYDRNNL